MMEMLGPAYAIPILNKGANHELRRYVKSEFNDDECHWFNCRSRRNVEANGSWQRNSWFAKLKRSRRETRIEASPNLVACAVVIRGCSEEEHGRSTVNE